MSKYFDVLQIVMAIATPFLVWWLLATARELLAWHRQREERKAEEAKKQSPFDNEAEFYKVPNPKMIGVRLKKRGEVVWEGGIYKEGIEL